MKPKPETCRGCPAYQWGIGFVEPEGPPTAKVAIVGQGPGEQEAEFSRPFIGPSGRMLDQWIGSAGTHRSKLWIGNLVWCWLPERKNPVGRGIGNRAPTKAEATTCYERHLGPALAQLPEDVHLVAVGSEAIRFLYGLGPKDKIDPYIGSPKLVDLPKLGEPHEQTDQRASEAGQPLRPQTPQGA